MLYSMPSPDDCRAVFTGDDLNAILNTIQVVMLAWIGAAYAKNRR